ncbi:MAG: hypothetical protein HZB39_12290 [Planctomycetes bacterium]|nr:hypothetical protein [Planctomycetota bacterium]
MRSRRRSLLLVAIAAAIAIVALLLRSGPASDTPTAAESDAGSGVSDPAIAIGGAESRRTGIEAPPRFDLSGRTITRDGTPTAARLSIMPIGEAGAGEERGLSIDIDASGILAATIPHTWTAGTVAAESIDGLRRGQASWSVEHDFDQGTVRLGDVVLELNPVLELELQVEDAVRVAFAALPGATFEVVASPGSGAGGIGPLNAPRQTTLHRFLFADGDRQIATVRIPKDCIDARGVTRVLWRFRREDDQSSSWLQEESIDALQKGARSELRLTGEYLLSGEVLDRGTPSPPLSMTALVFTRSAYSATFLSDWQGRFLLLVPPRSSGSLWIGLLGQKTEKPWTAGQPVRMDVDLSGFLRVRVVDGRGTPVQRCALGAGCAWEPPGSNAKRKTEYSPEGRFMLWWGSLRPGDMIFVSTPEIPPRMHVCERAVSTEDGDYVIDIDAARVPRASLRIMGVDRYIGTRDVKVFVHFRLVMAPLNERKLSHEYFLEPEGNDWQADGLFAGDYSYEFQVGLDVIARGEVALRDGEVATVRL